MTFDLVLSGLFAAFYSLAFAVGVIAVIVRIVSMWKGTDSQSNW